MLKVNRNLWNVHTIYSIYTKFSSIVNEDVVDDDDDDQQDVIQVEEESMMQESNEDMMELDE